MVYTAQLGAARQIGATIKLDHEYTTTVMAPLQLSRNLTMNQQTKTFAFNQQTKTFALANGQQAKGIPFFIQARPAQPKISQQQIFNKLSEQAKTTLSRDSLANKLRENWREHKQPEQKINLDDSLTSLGWLHGMNLMKQVAAPTPPPSPTLQDTTTEVNPNQVLTVVNNNQQVTRPQYVSMGGNQLSTVERIDYRSNGYVKPPYSYATLICMAIKETGVEKITLSAIYQWITENFMYYRLADPSWQNSIRHNLSLNKCFQKVPRRKDEPGKGGFWRINPEYSDMLVDGVLKKRRTNISSYYQPPVKKIKTEAQDPWGTDKPQSNTPQCQERQFVINEGVSQNDLRNGNYSWNQLLNQDIMVGGLTIKTEDIIDAKVTCLEEAEPQEPQNNLIEQAFNSPDLDIDIGEMTPPSSGNSNSDNSLDEFFDFTTEYQNSPLDMSASGLALDLTLQGVSLKAPQWWETPSEPPHKHQEGMHTPVHSSDSLDEWKPRLSEIEEAIDAFDIDNLFDTSS